MELRPFGAKGPAAPVIGQGTWNMEAGDRRAAIAAIRRGLDLGMTHIDTAEMYGGGEVERLLAEALKGRRDEVFLVSKVMPHNGSYAGTLKACESSLQRLGTDRLECLLLHWPGPHPLAETIRAFAKLKADGKIRSFGVSNFDVELLDEAVKLAGPSAIACDQVLYHLEERGVEHGLVARCAELGVALVGYSPFGQGMFPDESSRGGRVLQQIADAHGVSPYTVALRFLIREPHAFAIPKSSRVEHVEANAAAAKLKLTPDELQKIDAAFPLGPNRGLPTA